MFDQKQTVIREVILANYGGNSRIPGIKPPLGLKPVLRLVEKHDGRVTVPLLANEINRSIHIRLPGCIRAVSSAHFTSPTEEIACFI